MPRQEIVNLTLNFYRASGVDVRDGATRYTDGLHKDPKHSYRLYLTSGPAVPHWFAQVTKSAYFRKWLRRLQRNQTRKIAVFVNRVRLPLSKAPSPIRTMVPLQAAAQRYP
jgi:hypothetical protein